MEWQLHGDFTQPRIALQGVILDYMRLDGKLVKTLLTEHREISRVHKTGRHMLLMICDSNLLSAVLKSFFSKSIKEIVDKTVTQNRFITRFIV